MRQKVFELEQWRLGRRGGVRRVVTDWTGTHRYSRRRGAIRSRARRVRRTLAEDRQACNGAPPRIAPGTRCSCTIACKEQAGNRGTRPAVVFYSRGLRSPLVQPPEDLRFPAPQQKCLTSSSSARKSALPRG